MSLTISAKKEAWFSWIIFARKCICLIGLTKWLFTGLATLPLIRTSEVRYVRTWDFCLTLLNAGVKCRVEGAGESMSLERALKPPATWAPCDESPALCYSLQSVVRTGSSHQHRGAVGQRPAPAGPWRVCSSTFLQDSLAREGAVTARQAWWPTSTACLQLWRGHWERTQMVPRHRRSFWSTANPPVVSKGKRT